MQLFFFRLLILYFSLCAPAFAKTPPEVKEALRHDRKCLSVAKKAFKKGFEREFHEYLLQKEPLKGTVDWSQFDFSDDQQYGQAQSVYQAIYNYFNKIIEKLGEMETDSDDGYRSERHKFTLFKQELDICFFALREAKRDPSQW
ncbi:MAG TPA: hypothetical protein VMW10_12755 [Alphaproteobacteria bacterium]|nr:hypothetical protein [Alphaproteobacteria bacterium]